MKLLQTGSKKEITKPITIVMTDYINYRLSDIYNNSEIEDLCKFIKNVPNTGITLEEFKLYVDSPCSEVCLGGFREDATNLYKKENVEDIYLYFLSKGNSLEFEKLCNYIFPDIVYTTLCETKINTIYGRKCYYLLPEYSSISSLHMYTHRFNFVRLMFTKKASFFNKLVQYYFLLVLNRAFYTTNILINENKTIDYYLDSLILNNVSNATHNIYNKNLTKSIIKSFGDTELIESKLKSFIYAYKNDDYFIHGHFKQSLLIDGLLL